MNVNINTSKHGSNGLSGPANNRNISTTVYTTTNNTEGHDVWKRKSSSIISSGTNDGGQQPIKRHCTEHSTDKTSTNPEVKSDMKVSTTSATTIVPSTKTTTKKFVPPPHSVSKVKKILWSWDPKGIKEWKGTSSFTSSTLSSGTTSSTWCVRTVWQEYDEYAKEIIEGVMNEGWTIVFVTNWLEFLRVQKFNLPDHRHDEIGMKRDVCHAAAIVATLRQEPVTVSFRKHSIRA